MCVLRFKRKRKIANAKIYEDKRDLYVAELYFIGFVNPENISLGTKSIFLAGLEIEISQKNGFGDWIRRPF